MNEGKATDSKLLDSSVWLAFLIERKHKDIIEVDEIFLLSSLSLFEIKKKLLKDKINHDSIIKTIEFIKSKNIILPVTKEIAENAADISIEKNIPSIDSIIYATAILNQAKLITLDNDFRNLPNVEIL